MAYTKWKDVDQVERYAIRRYRSWDQRWIDKREKKIVQGLFTKHKIRGIILDIPVGPGRFQPLLSKFGDVLSADLGYMPVLYQKERVGISCGSINANAEHIPLQTNSVDIIFCFRLFQHMHKSKERVAILREFNRVSKSWVVVSCYLSSVLHNIHRRIIQQPSRITLLKKREFEEEINESGLKLIEMSSVVPGLHANRICLFSTNGSAQIPLGSSPP